MTGPLRTRDAFPLCVLMALGLVGGSATQIAAQSQALSPADGPWSGQAQCVLTARGSGFEDEQTHTWRITGEPPRVTGSIRHWPAVWSVQGRGRRDVPGTGARAALTETWTITVPETSGPLAIWEIPGAGGDNRLRIGSQHGLLVAPGAMTLRATSGQILTPTVQEWVFPAAEDVVASTTITGTRTRTLPGGPAYRKPPEAVTTETCTWHFTRGSTSSRASIATMADQAPPAITPAGRGTVDTIATPGSATAAPAPPAATIDTGRTRERVLTAAAQQALADAAAAAAETACSTGSGGSSSSTPCATISGPGRLAQGSTGNFVVALRNAPGQTTVTMHYPNADGTIAAIVTNRTDIIADFRFDSGEGESQNRTLTSLHAAPVLLAPVSVTFTFQSGGTFIIVAQVVVTARTTTQTDRPIYDPTTKQQIRVDTQMSQQTRTWSMLVKKVVTVAPAGP
jgi:hypothetical protein